MRTRTDQSRPRHLRLGVPAAVLGTLAATLTAPPASAMPDAASAAVVRPGSPTLRAVPTATRPATHVVRAGETVSAIAERFGLRTVDVLTWNGLSWRSVIYPGQTLRLHGPTTPASAPAAPAPAPAAARTHTVVAGDTVFGIARANGTTVDAVLAANGLSRSSVIHPGQRLVVGRSSPATSLAPSPSTPAAAAPAASATHTVVAGDTIFAIAAKYGTTTRSVFALNSLGADSIIYPGQKLVVRGQVAPAAGGGQRAAALDAEQSANATLIIRIGREIGVSDRAIAIALATGMVESGLRNLDWGDRDSLGIFQQRPSTGWGEPGQIMDADRSTRVFFGGPHDPNGDRTRGLLDISGWEGMPFTAAAQAVQISAYPDRYGQWEKQAYAWLAELG